MMNKYSLSIKFYPLESGSSLCPIYCRITVNRKKAEFNTQQKVALSKWQEDKQRVKGNPELNAFISGIESKILSQHSLLMNQGKTITASILRDLCTGKYQTYYTLLDYYSQFQKEIDELKDEFTISTIKKYKTIRIHLESFLKSKKQTSILLTDFNLQSVSEFEFYLKTIAGLNTNTTTKYLKQLKAIFNRAVRFGIIESVPFENFKYKHERVEREFLTKEEIETLETFVSPNESLDRVKDVFLFSIYTGLRYSDVNNLNNKNLRSDKEGNTWIDFTMVKTNKSLSLPLMIKAKNILNKYKTESEITGKILPVISNQKSNAYLKVLGDLAGLKKTLTYHMARHTFATTITLSNEVPIEVVSKMLGHSNLATTQIYAKITNDYLLKTTEQLNKKVK